MDINTIGGACVAVAYVAACIGILVAVFTPVNFYLLDKMFLLLNKVFPLTPKN